MNPVCADHPVVRPDAPLGHVPRALEHLERLQVLVPGALQREDELLDLHVVGRYPQTIAPGGAPPRARRAPPTARAGRGPRGRTSPAFGHLPDVAPRGARASPAALPRNDSMLLAGLRLELGPQVVGDHPALGSGRPAQRQRERPRARAGLEHRARDARRPRRGSRRRPSGRRPARRAASSGRSRPSAAGTPGTPSPWPNARRPLVGPDHEVVRHRPAVRVPRLPRLQASAGIGGALVQQQDPLPGLERSAHLAVVP